MYTPTTQPHRTIGAHPSSLLAAFERRRIFSEDFYREAPSPESKADVVASNVAFDKFLADNPTNPEVINLIGDIA